MPRFRWPRAAVFALLVALPGAAASQDNAADAGDRPRRDAEGAAAERRAGARYDAGGMRTFFLGENYRELWTMPVLAPELNPDTVAGGLTLLREGGGLSTEALRLRGADGREYVLRSVDKNMERAMPPDLRGTLTESVIQDLVSAEHPGGALAVPRLLRGAGVLHVRPRLYRIPDHPFLDSTRTRFRDRLAILEVRPTDGWAGSPDIQGSDDFQKLIEDDPVNRVDAHAFLTARLMDIYIGDWDRQWSQWRWARYDADGLRWWKPIPRDRDNAFFDVGGFIPGLARPLVPTLLHFGPRMDDIIRYHVHMADMDRRILSSLPRAAWDSIALSLRARMTDELINAAVRDLPVEYFGSDGAELAWALQSRRDEIPAAADRLYRMMSREVDVHVTDQAEAVVIERNPDGSLDLTVHTAADRPQRPYFSRRFEPSETEEVRLYLHGGDDRVAVRGTPGGIRVRVIGGGGDDLVSFETRDAGRTPIYDDRGNNRLEGSRAGIDDHDWDRPTARSLTGLGFRDWGSGTSLLTPYVGWGLNVGAVIGVGPTWTQRGFRRAPYAQRFMGRVLYAPQGGFGGILGYERMITNRPASIRVEAYGSGFEDVRFHGLGNDTPDEPVDDLYLVDQTQVRLLAAYEWRPGRWRIFAGPAAKWTDPGELRAVESDVLGDETFWQAGLAGGVELDGRDRPLAPRRGGRLALRGDGYGTDLWSPFGRVEGEAAGYLSLPGGGPTLALRGGGQVALGRFPFQESAYVGGPGTLRGYGYQRYRGDAALSGSAELRVPVTYANLGLARVHLGVFGLADAGRVYLDGDSPGGWHTGVGGGLTFRTLGHAGSVAYAHGERGILYVSLGMPF